MNLPMILNSYGKIGKRKMDKVTVKLMGGLCNYLFQIACAYAYSIKNGKELFLTEDDSIVVHKHLSTYEETVLSKVKLSTSIAANWNRFNEKGFNYTEIPNTEGNVYLNGYFQSEKYFKEYGTQIKELFTYPKEYVDTVLNKYKDLLEKNTCSIHVRRGDYLKFPDHHPTQNMNYYMRAIKQMSKDSMFLIFSDDIVWCKKNFPNIPEKFMFIEGNTDSEDFLLMSLCNNNIICNSTFSWWAAWLNRNEQKKVIAPSVWFGSAKGFTENDMKDLYCENWIKI